MIIDHPASIPAGLLDPAQAHAAYAGIGSRETPEQIQRAMTRIGRQLGQRGFTLRSGGAPGADTAFAAGARQAGSAAEIYVPWQGFAHIREEILPRPDLFGRAMQIAAETHPAWDRCSGNVRRLHARNCFQILGPDLNSPSRFVICWTRDGRYHGGTGQALRIATRLGIPILNLHNPEILQWIEQELSRPATAGRSRDIARNMTMETAQTASGKNPAAPARGSDRPAMSPFLMALKASQGRGR